MALQTAACAASKPKLPQWKEKKPHAKAQSILVSIYINDVAVLTSPPGGVG